MPSLNQSLVLKLKQEQKLTQKLIQKLEMIPLSNFELDNLVENEMMINDFLQGEKNDNSEKETDSPDISDNLDMDKEVLYSQNDWEDFRKKSTKKDYYSAGSSDFLENIAQKEIFDFRKHLKTEIMLKSHNKKTLKTAYFIIELLDYKGFLHYKPEILAELIIKRGENLSDLIDHVKEVVSIIKDIEPYGAGSYDLKEYLLYQYTKLCIEDAVVFNIINDYLEELSRNKLSYIATKLDVDVFEVQKALEKIREKIPPYPSFGFVQETVEYVKPDATIKEDGEIIIHTRYRSLKTVNHDFFKNKISQFDDKKTINFYKKQYEKAKELVNNYNSRNSLFEDLLKIIYREQKDFFYGKSLSPLKQITVAEELGVNVSTISRTVKSKYIRVPKGIMKAGDFFVNVSTGDISSDEAMNRIREIVEKEDKRKPLSDDKITKILKEKFNIDIKRRTVTKYREKMDIGSSRQRKEFK